MQMHPHIVLLLRSALLVLLLPQALALLGPQQSTPLHPLPHPSMVMLRWILATRLVARIHMARC